jgi:hypothetical protein
MPKTQAKVNTKPEAENAHTPESKLEDLYSDLEKTKRGSGDSKRLSEQILETIFDSNGSR